MKTILICHEKDRLDREGIARWLASFSDLAGIIILRETGARFWNRIRREIARAGVIRFFDVAGFRVYYRVFLSRKDRMWKDQKLKELCKIYPEVSKAVSILYARSPNTPEVERFIKELSPDMMLARCKALLEPNIFSIPSRGTFAMHPGISPEYRNAHGCFWALVEGDPDKVGMTLLKVDEGVDTGPVFGYYTYEYNADSESHVIIQYRVILDNLDKIRKKFEEIYSGSAKPFDTKERKSAVWGHPRLTSYLKWKNRMLEKIR